MTRPAHRWLPGGGDPGKPDRLHGPLAKGEAEKTVVLRALACGLVPTELLLVRPLEVAQNGVARSTALSCACLAVCCPWNAFSISSCMITGFRACFPTAAPSSSRWAR